MAAVMKKQELKLYMQFYVDDNRYVLPAHDIIAVVPLVSLHEVPQGPEYVVGILNYHWH
ncbi:chemotaxis protein CheW [Kaarinaea lacus]